MTERERSPDAGRRNEQEAVDLRLTWSWYDGGYEERYEDHGDGVITRREVNVGDDGHLLQRERFDVPTGALLASTENTWSCPQGRRSRRRGVVRRLTIATASA